MSSTSPTSTSRASQPEPLSPESASGALRLHVLVTPTHDRRALSSSLAALAALREPRLEVTAVAPPGGLKGLKFDPRFRVLPEARSLSAAPHAALGLAEGSVLFILAAGAIPPRGWVEVLLDAGRLPHVRAVAAHPWTPATERPPQNELLRWEREERLARKDLYRLVEDRAELETPMLAIFHPTELAGELADYLRGPADQRLCLRPKDSHSIERLLVAKELLVWQAVSTQAIKARVICGSPDAVRPESSEEADALEARLLAALEAGPRPELSLRLSRLALSRGERKAALDHARRCLDAWPECAEAKLYAARAQTGEGQLAAARSTIEDLLHAGPLRVEDRASIFACLASIWLHKGEPSQAKPCLEVALSLSPDNALARYCQARLALAGGRFSEALEHLEVCLLEVPLSPDIHFELGRARVLAGFEARGLEALERALELNPGHKKAGALLARLTPLH